MAAPRSRSRELVTYCSVYAAGADRADPGTGTRSFQESPPRGRHFSRVLRAHCEDVDKEFKTETLIHVRGI
jgi:hypothetical protein